MAEQSGFWDSTGTGDGSAGGYTETQLYQHLEALFLRTKASECVLKNFLNALVVSGTATPVSIATGAAVVAGFWYINDASTTLAVPTPAASTRIDRIILRVSWSAQTVRLVRLAGVEGGAAPTLTQTLNTTYEVSLAQVSITTGGVITVTDERQYAKFNTEVDTSSLKDDSVTLAKMADMATDRLLGRDTASSGNPEEISLTGGLEFTGSAGIQIANDGVTYAKIQDMTTDRLLGRDTAATGIVEELTVGGGVEFSGSGGIQRSALTGDVTASAGSGTTVLTARLRNAIVPLAVITTQVGNVTTGEDDLASYTVPGGTLSVNGDSLWFEASGSYAANTNNKSVRVRFGTSGTTLLGLEFSATVTGGEWVIRGRIIRTGAATQKGYFAGLHTHPGLTNPEPRVDSQSSLDQTLSGDVVLKVTGEATATNDILLETFVVGFNPAS
jgi:hypothetical protein